MKLPRNALDWLIFGLNGSEGGERRYTQDSPVLPDVWIAFGREPGKPQELLITPHRESRPGAVAAVLRKRLGEISRETDEAAPAPGHGLAYTESNVAVRLDLGELLRVVLPLTSWWTQEVTDRLKAAKGEDQALSLDERLGQVLERIGESGTGVRGHHYVAPKPKQRSRKGADLPPDLVWLARIVGWLAWAEDRPEPEEPLDHLDAFHAWRRQSGPRATDLVAALVTLLRDPGASSETLSLGEGLRAIVPKSDVRIWLVNRNRPAQLAVQGSQLAIKADAAWQLFSISCKTLKWAVVDSGIDATHPAFRQVDPETGKLYPLPFPKEGDKVRNRTRVERTFDFSRVRLLLDPSLLDAVLDGTVGAESGDDSGSDLPAGVERSIDRLVGGGGEERTRQSKLLHEHVGDLLDLLTGPGRLTERLRDQLDDLRKRLLGGQDLDWSLLEPFLEVRPDQYWIPASDHGTHVAGILAGSWEQDSVPVYGICRDLALYDFRVLPTGRPGPEDELNVIAALQFLRYLNRQRDALILHGANLSLSIPHEVANFACGRTPVCDEASRLVSSGVVVVAAAGNNGYLRYQTAQGEREGYHTISITDPGNAEDVITVGATHRNRPHTYGVSYFSSRGPTGDGRPKPDLVAPGEKIRAPVLDADFGEKDGTSMAAPHVSGAAAILMARHRELVGRPRRIKEILCSSATDLGREHYFQGRGMLDVLRALQSV